MYVPVQTNASTSELRKNPYRRQLLPFRIIAAYHQAHMYTHTPIVYRVNVIVMHNGLLCTTNIMLVWSQFGSDTISRWNADYVLERNMAITLIVLLSLSLPLTSHTHTLPHSIASEINIRASSQPKAIDAFSHATFQMSCVIVFNAIFKLWLLST